MSSDFDSKWLDCLKECRNPSFIRWYFECPRIEFLAAPMPPSVDHVRVALANSWPCCSRRSGRSPPGSESMRTATSTSGSVSGLPATAASFVAFWRWLRWWWWRPRLLSATRSCVRWSWIADPAFKGSVKCSKVSSGRQLASTSGPVSFLRCARTSL